MMSLYSLLSAVELGLIYALMVLGLFLSYRILNIPDLTVDGSFTLGAAVAVVLTLDGHPVLGHKTCCTQPALSFENDGGEKHEARFCTQPRFCGNVATVATAPARRATA